MQIRVATRCATPTAIGTWILAQVTTREAAQEVICHHGAWAMSHQERRLAAIATHPRFSAHARMTTGARSTYQVTARIAWKTNSVLSDICMG